MEIQTFFLAEKITRLPDNRHDVQRVAIAFLECTPQTPFPVRFTLPGLILLRREGTGGEAPFTLRVTWSTRTAGPPGSPAVGSSRAVPRRPALFALMGKFDFEFPKPGSYRLDITVDEGLAGNIFSYNIDLWLRQGP